MHLKKKDLPEQRIKWRIHERIKTVAGALTLCLHIGVPPPDQLQYTDCARLECWLDPRGLDNISTDVINTEDTGNDDSIPYKTSSLANPTKTREAIGKALQSQYEYWNNKVKYKQLLDPTPEDIRRLLTALRKGAKKERLLFHYNGHGVPLCTLNGELWAFNRSYTQYIPIHIIDIDGWAGRPLIAVLDCSHAGRLLSTWTSNLSLDNEFDLVIFAACAAEEKLPLVPYLPADFLTACLTTPIQMALKWHMHRNNSLCAHESSLKIPAGDLTDRHTPLGLLNWIFTAITDALAWQTFDLKTFKALFRQDLLMASLARNFFLARRIGIASGINPQVFPSQLSWGNTHLHMLWDLWDQSIDTILANEQSDFFRSQMHSFRLWIEGAYINKWDPLTCPYLPIILQVLLSPDHRREALDLLIFFCSLGQNAVLAALHIGAHPYIVKLLQTSIDENLRKPLIDIWLRVIWVDWKEGSQEFFRDVLRMDVYSYVCKALKDPNSSCSEQATALACSTIFYKHNEFLCNIDDGEQLALVQHLVKYMLNDPIEDLRVWSIILMGNVRIRNQYFYQHIQYLVRDATNHSSSRIRASIAYMLANYINHNNEENNEEIEWLREQAHNWLENECSLQVRELIQNGWNVKQLELFLEKEFTALTKNDFHDQLNVAIQSNTVKLEAEKYPSCSLIKPDPLPCRNLKYNEQSREDLYEEWFKAIQKIGKLKYGGCVDNIAVAADEKTYFSENVLFTLLLDNGHHLFVKNQYEYSCSKNGKTTQQWFIKTNGVLIDVQQYLDLLYIFTTKSLYIFNISWEKPIKCIDGIQTFAVGLENTLVYSLNKQLVIMDGNELECLHNLLCSTNENIYAISDNGYAKLPNMEKVFVNGIKIAAGHKSFNLLAFLIFDEKPVIRIVEAGTKEIHTIEPKHENIIRMWWHPHNLTLYTLSNTDNDNKSLDWYTLYM